MQSLIRFYREARRRKVFRTATLYVVAAWALLQVAALSFPGFGIPDSAIRAAIWAAVLGFPFAVLFGWLFEIGPDGIRRTLPAAAGDLAKPRPLAARDYALLAAFALIASALLFQAVRGVRDTAVDDDSLPNQAEPAARQALSNSIAVLPFANISNDPDNEYFCDGVSEEILNTLAQLRELTVIGRTSSFAFKGSNAGIERISNLLGVRYLLQGSVRKSGSQLRISAQLVDGSGRQLWSQSFNRELVNVFDIQAEIAEAVASTVAAHVIARPQTISHSSPEAYDQYLAGRERLHRRDVGSALQQLGRAVELDPSFAEAHAEWAIARLMGFPTSADMEAARASIDRALELKPQLLRARAARGFMYLQSRPPDHAASESTLREVLAQDPNMSDALLWLSNGLLETGRNDEARTVLGHAVRIDPMHPSIVVNLSNLLLDRGEIDEAFRLFEPLLEQPDTRRETHFSIGEAYRRYGRLVELHAFGRAKARQGAAHYYPLMHSHALIGQWQLAEDWLAREARDFPPHPYFGYQHAMVIGWQGRYAESARHFDQAIASLGVDIRQEPAIVQRTYGAVLARAGRYAEAISILAPQIGPEPRQFRYGPTPQLDGAHALVWSWLRTGEEERGRELLSRLGSYCVERLKVVASPDGDLLHYCAENALLEGERERALALLERAVAAGWREYYLRRQDPYWAALQDDPRYRALMGKVRADVDRQAAEIARVDSADDLAGQLDAAAATRTGTR